MSNEKTERTQQPDQGAEKKALRTADANEARNASAADVREVQSKNPNKFESMTELPAIQDGKSQADKQAENQSFGIRMNDGTAVTGRGTEGPTPKKDTSRISVDPRPSYVEGLKAVVNDEEAQGRFSIEYMERKAKEAFAKLQKPADDQVLIASNISPVAPNPEQLQNYPEILSDSKHPTEEVVLRDEYFDRPDVARENDIGKQPAKDPLSERTPLIQFLATDPIIGQACRSGKSVTLTKLVTEMNKRPWTINAVYDKSANFQDYDAKDNTVHLGTKWAYEKKIDNFGHEAYHATHQDLDVLYGSKEPIERDNYLRLKMDQEAGAFLAEFKVNREFGHKPATSYEYAEGSKVKHKDIGELIVYRDKTRTVIDEKASKEAIGIFLSNHHSPIRNRNGWAERDSWTGEIHTSSYPKQHEESFKQYRQHFDENRATLLKHGWLSNGY